MSPAEIVARLDEAAFTFRHLGSATLDARQRMDEAIGWLNAIPPHRKVERRIVSCRVGDMMGFSLERIAQAMNTTVDDVKRRHAEGIRQIARRMAMVREPAA